MIEHRSGFWRDAFTIHGSITPHVMPLVFVFGSFAAVVCVSAGPIERLWGIQIGLPVAPYEIAGAVLGLLLVLRTNAGYDRWWEARKLWGGIVNQSRNLAISGLSYGPEDAAWQDRFVRWVAAFPHVARCSLRGQPSPPEVAELVGSDAAARVAAADHMPSYVALQLGRMLRDACDHQQLDRFAFLQIDRERALLIDHVGACERILKTPLPHVYAIKIRRFVVVFMVTLPFALLHQLNAIWLIPFITMLVAYPVVSLDQIGVELQNPFCKQRLSHLPIGEISAAIERNVRALPAELQDDLSPLLAETHRRQALSA